MVGFRTIQNYSEMNGVALMNVGRVVCRAGVEPDSDLHAAWAQQRHCKSSIM